MTRNELWVILGVAAVLGGIIVEGRFHADGQFAELRREVRENRAELKGDIAALRVEFKGDIEALRVEFKGDIDAARVELKGDIAEIRDDIAAIREDIAGLNTRVSRIEGKLDKPSPRPENIDPRLVQALIERLEQEGFRRAAPPDATGR